MKQVRTYDSDWIENGALRIGKGLKLMPEDDQAAQNFGLKGFNGNKKYIRTLDKGGSRANKQA